MRICLTAGDDLSDILWAATALPFVRRAAPQAHLAWECAVTGFGEWLQGYAELDEVIGDVEEMDPVPDVYRIVHPFWCPPDPSVQTPLEAVFAIVRPLTRVITGPLPGRPYCPPAPNDPPHTEGLPPGYICLDPHPGGGLAFSEKSEPGWVTLAAYLSIPAVQVGSRATPLLSGLIDARGCGPLELARLISHALLYIGADTGPSCLASALNVPRIWTHYPKSNWWWPRTEGPRSALFPADSQERLDVPGLLSSAWILLNDGGAGHAD